MSEYSSVPFKAHSRFAFHKVNPNLAFVPMTTSTENSSPHEETQTPSDLPGLYEKTQPEPSNSEPEALGSKLEAQLERNSGGDSVSSAVLPASKARSIALVATVTGATFLNVNLHQLPLAKFTFLTLFTDVRRTISCDRTSNYCQRFENTSESNAMDSVFIYAHLWLLPTFMGQDRRSLR